MNIDHEDILFTNEYVRMPLVEDSLNIDEFNSFYKQSRLSTVEPKSNRLSRIPPPGSEDVRYEKQVRTLVSIDSRDRDMVLYPKPSDFLINLDKSFYNVKSVKLNVIEFPNTNAVINSTNRNLYWINQEDVDLDIIDTITTTYPMYNVQLRIGSYTSSKLETEIQNAMKKVRRRNKTGEFHYFAVNLDVETDVTTFISLILSQLPTNPLSSTLGTGIVSVESSAHKLVTGDTVYILSSRSVGGISTDLLNSSHVVIVINENRFQIEVTEKAAVTEQGGGTNVKTGKPAPFQLLFGDYTNTVSKNIGYLNENSSEQVVTNVKSVVNFYQAHISLKTRHGLVRNKETISTPSVVSASGTFPNIDGTRGITDILSESSILVSINELLTVPSFDQGELTINGVAHAISSIENFKTRTVLVETFTNHRYGIDNVGTRIVFYETTTIPELNDDSILSMVLSPRKFLVFGELLVGGSVNTSVPGAAGYIPLYSPLETRVIQVSSMYPGENTGFVTTTDHSLKVGDSVSIYRVESTPPLSERSYSVFSIPSSTEFRINARTIEVAPTVNTLVGTSTVTLSFPGHGFNSVTSITNYSTGTVLVQTLLDHKFVDGSLVRLSSSNTVPNIDDGGYVVTFISSDLFTIPFPVPLTVSGTYAAIGMSMEFSLYRVLGVGGFSQISLNGQKFRVREILDEDSFTFDVIGSFSMSNQLGGGTGIFINGFTHGFYGVQSNTKNGVIDRSITLEGENYTFLTSPQLATMRTTGKVSDIFARITLDQSPGSMVFNFLSNPKEFDTVPLDKMDQLQFSMKNPDNTFYEFNDMDFSFVVEVTEVQDINHDVNKSSRRGV